jgi:uncharacterized protein YjdB
MLRRRSGTRWTQGLVGLWLASLAACGGGGDGAGIVTPAPIPDPIVVAIAPSSVANLEVGGSTQLTASVTGGAAAAVRTVTWASSADAIIRVSATGLVTAVAPGQAVITATADADRSKTSQVTVIANAPRVTAISVNAAAGTLLIGQTTAVTATVTATGAGSNTRVRFTSSAPAVATVTTTDGITGTVTAVGRGDAQIIATAELDATRTATVAIRVNELRVASVQVTAAADSVPLGANLSLSATLRDASGATLTGRPITWSSSTPSVATVSSLGLLSTVTPGVTTIMASVPVETGSTEVVSGTFQVRVVSGLRLALSPRGGTLRPTEQLPLTATVSGGATAIDRTVEYVSRTPAVASVSAAGVVTGVALGSTRIVARMRADTLVRDSITVSVLDPCGLAFVHTLGGLTNGTITTASCRVDNGGQISFLETIAFTATQALAVEYRFQSTATLTDFNIPYPEGNSVVWFTPQLSPTQTARGVVYLTAGRYFASGEARNQGTGTFQFETTLNPDPNNICGLLRFAMTGTSFTTVLGGSCGAVNIQGMTRLAAGARLQARATATAYPVRVQLCDASLDCTASPLAIATATGPGGSAIATFVNGAAGSRFWYVRISSPTVGALGPAQVSIDP